MGFAVVHSRAIDGLGSAPVRVEVHLANGLPCLNLVGLADTEVREARERVRSALHHTGLGYPHNQRVTVNLAPADLPKESGRFDLPIALGILAAQGLIDTEELARHEFAGELSLAGELRPVRGALALALGLRRDATGAATGGPPARRLVLPTGSAEEAAWVEGVTVLRADHLMEVVQALTPGGPTATLDRAQPPRPVTGGPSVASQVGATRAFGPEGGALGACDLQDVRGQAAAKRALEVAAAGHHNLLFVGPPGSGKSMLAQRLHGLLPRLTEDEALDSAAVASVSRSGFDPSRWGARPWRAPHHSCSSAALVGGGSPPRPGEISLAHHGVLFLDELLEFPARALESLREPLEVGHVVLSRAARQARFPCRLLLVAAMNPCPCGWFGSPAQKGRPACRCTPDAVLRYQGRLSGPLLDRLDLQVEVPAITPAELMGPAQGERSEVVQERVMQARQRQLARQGGLNAQLGGADLLVHAALDASAQAFLQRAAERLGWSGRGLHRVLRVARTVADLAGSATVQVPHLAEAVQMRRGLAAPQPSDGASSLRA